MAKRRRVVYKTPATGGCRRRARWLSYSDEDDKDYVVGEDESDSAIESLVASSYDDDIYDENFEINTGDDGNSDDDHDEDDDFVPFRSKNFNVCSRKARKVACDVDYVEEKEEEFAVAPITKGKRTARSRRRKSRAASEDDEDFNPDDEFDDEEVVEILKNSERKKNSSRPCGRPPRNMRQKAPKQKKVVKKRRMITDLRSDDDDFVVDNVDFIVKDRVSGNKIRKDRCKSSKKKRNVNKERFARCSDAEDLDFVVDSLDEELEGEPINNKTRKNTKRNRSRVTENSEQELKDSELDFDFSISDENVRESVVPKRKIQKRGRVNRKKSCSAADRVYVNKIRKDRCRSSKKKTNVNKKRFARYSDAEDLDFVVESLDEEWEGETMNNKTRKNTKRNRSLVTEDSEQELKDSESDFDFSISDEDVRESVVPKRKIQKKGRINRKKSCSAADSESSDFVYEISEGELRDLQIPKLKAPKPLHLPKRSIVKGKEKEVEDLGKQVCGICLSEEQKTTIQGMLDCCSHYYCYQCIMEWSKVESRCPVCKRRFSTITKMGRTDLGFGLRKQVIKVSKRDQVYQPSEEEVRGYIDPYENVVCIVCQQGGDDSIMLLCDICDSSAHTYCVGLGTVVPEGNWYCEACRLTDDGLPRTRVQDSASGHAANSANSLFAGFQTEDLHFNLHGSSNAQNLILSPGDPGHFFSHGFDLNAPPRDCFEEELSTPSSQFSAGGALTLSGRRAIHQRIRFILSGRVNRSRELSTSDENGIKNTSLPEPGIGASYHAEKNVVDINSFGHSRFRLSPCMLGEDDNFRHVDGAKDYVQSSIKDC